MIKLDHQPNVVLRPQRHADLDPVRPAKRGKIWELSDTLHCSIVGTCLSNAELRRVIINLKVRGAESADDHELHVIGVMLAGHPEAGAKLLQKALDRRHGLSIKQYARAKDEQTLRRLWEDSVHSGDIPGAYWALLSHPVATDTIVKKAFQDVHMLSHLVGAANRADIRRLRQLEDQNATLTDKLHRQQLQLRDGFTSRDETIRRLKDMLVRSAHDTDEAASADHESGDEIETYKGMIADLSRKLGQETTRREHLEQRLNAMSNSLKGTEASLRTAENERDACRREIELIEHRFVGLLEPQTDESDGTLDLSGRTVLYVGGRAHQIPQLKGLVERTGGHFLHHDGGIEHSSSLLPGLASRADVVCFPVDCISHDAVAAIKRLCRQLEKPYQPLRTASLAALMASLATVFHERETEIAAG